MEYNPTTPPKTSSAERLRDEDVEDGNTCGGPRDLPKQEAYENINAYPEPKGDEGLKQDDSLKTVVGNSRSAEARPMPMPTDVEEKNSEAQPYRRKNWWRRLISCVNVFRYYITARKYGEHSITRNQIIANLSKDLYTDLDTIKDCMKFIQQEFIDEFRVFTDLNLSFNNYSGSLVIKEQSEKIMAFINKFMKYLIKYSARGNDVPDEVQKIVYKYIRTRGYFPKKFLSTFEIYRLDFNFYGETVNHSDATIGMIVALLIISKAWVLQVMMHPIENYEEFKDYKYIQMSCKYVGSILHYLVRDAFKTDPPMVKDNLALLNYYRNYHIYNEQVEKTIQDVTKNDIQYKDIDELSNDLVDEETISSFFETNQKWVEAMKKYIFQWAVNLGRYIQQRFQGQEI